MKVAHTLALCALLVGLGLGVTRSARADHYTFRNDTADYRIRFKPLSAACVSGGVSAFDIGAIEPGGTKPISISSTCSRDLPQWHVPLAAERVRHGVRGESTVPMRAR